jgi:S-adenosylmethionine synthetase
MDDRFAACTRGADRRREEGAAMKRDFIFSSESVTEGHPDKLCDRISDALVGQYLRRDPLSRVNVECAVSTGILFVAVRLGSSAVVDIPFAARDVIREVGYERDGFNARDCTIMTTLSEYERSHVEMIDEMSMSHDDIDHVTARDQVTVFGFACNQTPSLMPLPVWLAHKLARCLAGARGDLPELLPDGKVQVSVEFRDRRPTRIHGLTVVTTLHNGQARHIELLRERVRTFVIEPAFAGEQIVPDEHSRVEINPEDVFASGGPAMHSGLTGRKTAVDTYGEYARHSGAALSGKDPSRIDRVGAYVARHAAKNIVAAGLASECEVQLTYSIGLSRPVSVLIDTFGTGSTDESSIERRVQALCDFRPAAIVKRFGLRQLPATRSDGFYTALAAYGHVGRVDIDLPWERTDLVDALRSP